MLGHEVVDVVDTQDPALFAIFGVVGIVAIVAAGAFSKKLGVAAPLLLILIGFGFSYIPGAPNYVPHELILMGLLPPILYSAALNVPIVDFRRNFSSISALSVTLVVVTAFVAGFVLWLLFPALPFAAALAVGAVISPTDAVAATALGKRLGLPPRLISILEGESLVNDATALVLLRSAIAAIATTVTFWEAALDFAFAVTIAIAIGLVVGVVTVWVRSKLQDSVLDTAVSFAVPFIAFLPTDYLGASGVLAVVVAGLYSGHSSARRFSAQSRITERLNWRTVQFVLENGVFLLMGLQISLLIDQVEDDHLSAHQAVLSGLLMVVVVLGVRFVFIGPLLFGQKAVAKRFEQQGPQVRGRLEQMRSATQSRSRDRRLTRLEKLIERRENDLEDLRADALGWRGGVVLGWAGMRGVVTLAAAQSIPTGTPYRAQLILIAFTVAVVTLLVQGGTLPWLIKLVGIKGVDRKADRRDLAELLEAMGSAGLAVLDDRASTVLPGGGTIDAKVVEQVRKDTLLSAEAAWERANHGGGKEELQHSPHRQYRELRREVLAAEREALLEARSAGTYPSRILLRAQSLLDLEETRLEQIDNGGS